jgi:minor curlin subunit
MPLLDCPHQIGDIEMNKKINIILSIGALILSAAVAHADTTFSSPAFVKQATGSGFSRMDTTSIMKPMMDIISAVPRVDTSGLANNLAFITQTGDFNTANIEQVGSRNVGLIQQIGYANSASITQTGNGHQAFVFQQGRNNMAIISQR